MIRNASGRRMTAVIAVFVCLLICLGGVAYAADGEGSESGLSGDVGLLRTDNGHYVMQVTVENEGEDFSGTVQVIFAGGNTYNCAYNTELTLPAQGRKQFTITVTGRAAETARGLCALNFLNEQGELLESLSLKNVFGGDWTGIQVGILSDHYSQLTYLDAGGVDFDLRQLSGPLNLVELNGENLRSSLDGLYFLVIDQFDLSSLREEDIRAVEDWVRGGGWLIVGTGSYAEKTLSGFDEDFIGVEVSAVSEPGETNGLLADAEKYGYYYGYRDADVDFTRMAIADLDYRRGSGDYYESVEHPSVCCQVGDGAVSVLRFSLAEEELKKLPDYAIRNLYDEPMYQSESYRFSGGYMEMEYVGQRALNLIDGIHTNVDFTWLMVLIGVYVVIVGPVLYLILRGRKKSEWYWVGVPVLGLLFIVFVFFFGQGARVSGTRAYSVTVQQAESTWTDTYFLAYHPGVEPWEFRLNDRFAVAGPGWDGNYRGNSTNTTDYYYTVTSGSDGLSVGIWPRANFDNGFLYAGGKAEAKGRLSGEEIRLSDTDPEGTVQNETGCDMMYLAVWNGSDIMVFSDVKAGETLDSGQAAADGRCLYQMTGLYFDNLLYDMVGLYRGPAWYDFEQDAMAALLIGLGAACEAGTEDAGVIVGVVKDYEKAAADGCHETAYGCLYSYAEMEGDSHASN